MWKYLFHHRWWLTLLAISIYLGNYLYRFTTYRGLTKFINGLEVGAEISVGSTLFSFGLKLVGAHVLHTVIHYFLQQSVTKRLTQLFSDLLKRMLYYPVTFFQENSREKLLEVWHYLHNFESLMTEMIIEAPRAVVYLVYYTYSIGSFSLTSLGVVIGLNLLMLMLSNYYYRQQLEANQRKIDADTRTKARYLDAITQIEYIKSMRTEEHERQLIDGSYRDYHTHRDTDRWLGVVTETIGRLLNDTLMMVIYGFGAYLVVSGEASTIDVMYLAVHTGHFYHQLNALRSYYTHYQKLRPKLDQIFTFLNQSEIEEPEVGESVQLAGQIDFDAVTFGYTATPVLSDRSFEIPLGQTTLFSGPNGCGKSTCMKLLLRYYDHLNGVSNGTIRIGGSDHTTLSLDSIRRSIYYAAQQPPLFNDTLWNNLVYGLDDVGGVVENRIWEICETLNIRDWVEEQRHKIVGPSGEALSGGERKRVQLVNLLVHDRPMVVLDEPTNDLDRETVDWLMTVLTNSSFWVGKTVVIISHDVRFDQFDAHRIAFEP